jgi:gentisate 1,2-dioxygenase
MTLFVKPEMTAERGEFYQRASKKGLAPLWEVLAELVPPEPHPRCIPVVWHYDEIRPYIMESGKLISAEEAERRVMILENPGLPESRQVTNMRPGKRARTNQGGQQSDSKKRTHVDFRER